MKILLWPKALTVALLFAVSTLATTHARAFLKIGDIEGESIDDAHEGWIDISSIEFGIQRVGEGRASKAEFSDTTVTFRIDKSSPKLFLACFQGEVFSEATIELTKPSLGNRSIVYLRYKLTNAVVTSYKTSAEAGEIPTEEITLTFATVEMEYTVVKEDGSGGEMVSSGVISATGNNP